MFFENKVPERCERRWLLKIMNQIWSELVRIVRMLLWSIPCIQSSAYYEFNKGPCSSIAAAGMIVWRIHHHGSALMHVILLQNLQEIDSVVAVVGDLLEGEMARKVWLFFRMNKSHNGIELLLN